MSSSYELIEQERRNRASQDNIVTQDSTSEQGNDAHVLTPTQVTNEAVLVHDEAAAHESSADNAGPANSAGVVAAASSSAYSSRASTSASNAVVSPPKPPDSAVSRIWQWTWWWELGAILLSIACLAAMLVILGIVNDKPLSKWGAEMQPNTIVSILATAAKTSALFGLAEAVSQYKWMYFEDVHPLHHLQLYDGATRGPLSALALLARGRLTVVGSVAALIFAAALAFEPTAQATLVTRLDITVLSEGSSQQPQNGTLESLGASVGVAHNYTSASCLQPGTPALFLLYRSHTNIFDSC